MENADIAAVFNEMADLLDIQGGDRYRIRAFRRIARVLENLRAPVPSMIRQGSLGRVPGIGDGAVGRIKEILRSGTCGEHKHLVTSLPPGLRELLRIKGIGVKSVRHLYANEKITSIAELEEAVRSGRITRLPGFGEDQDKILTAIARYRREGGRLLLPEATRIGTQMVEAMRAESAVVAAELTGSARRRKETVGDLDVLVASHDPAPCVARFVMLPGIQEVLVRGDSKCSALIESGQQVDLRVIEPEAFGAGLHYFTGSQQHNIYIRARGNRRGIKISEHGVFRRMDEKLLDPCESEIGIFKAVGLPLIPPELRENCGEIEAAAAGKLPKLVTDVEIRGDAHVHTSQGVDEMIAAAAQMGLKWIIATDDAGEVRQTKDRAAILREKGKRAGLHVLPGIEVPILPDGTIGAERELLSQTDWVLASVHDGFDATAKEATARLVKAMATGLIDCIAHPTGRLLGERDGAPLDLETLFKAARRYEVALELNGDPRRLDLDSTSCRYAREMGITIALGTGARSPEALGARSWGVAVARRGWLEARDVINAKHASAILDRRQQRLRKHGVGGTAPSSLPDFAESLAELPVASFRQTQLELLDGQLKATPLPPELIERLEEFFRSGTDDILEEALAKIAAGRPPLQKAYELILSNESAPNAAAALQEEPGHEPAADDPVAAHEMEAPAPAKEPKRTGATQARRRPSKKAALKPKKHRPKAAPKETRRTRR